MEGTVIVPTLSKQRLELNPGNIYVPCHFQLRHLQTTIVSSNGPDQCKLMLALSNPGLHLQLKQPSHDRKRRNVYNYIYFSHKWWKYANLANTDSKSSKSVNHLQPVLCIFWMPLKDQLWTRLLAFLHQCKWNVGQQNLQNACCEIFFPGWN